MLCIAFPPGCLVPFLTRSLEQFEKQLQSLNFPRTLFHNAELQAQIAKADWPRLKIVLKSARNTYARAVAKTGGRCRFRSSASDRRDAAGRGERSEPQSCLKQ
jgi:hypothetical protein